MSNCCVNNNCIQISNLGCQCGEGSFFALNYSSSPEAAVALRVYAERIGYNDPEAEKTLVTELEKFWQFVNDNGVWNVTGGPRP